MENIYNEENFKISLSNNQNLIIDKNITLKRRSKEHWQELDYVLAEQIKNAIRKGARKQQINNIKLRHYVLNKCSNKNDPNSYTRHIRTIITSDGKIYVIINHKKFIKVTCNSKEQIKLSVMHTIRQCACTIGMPDIFGNISPFNTDTTQLCRQILLSAPKILLGNIYPNWVFNDFDNTYLAICCIGLTNIKHIKYSMSAEYLSFIVNAGIKTPEAIKIMSTCKYRFRVYFALKYFKFLKRAYKNTNVNVEILIANRMAKINTPYIDDVFYLFHEYRSLKRRYKEQLKEFELPNKFHKKDLKDAHDILAKLHRDMHNKLSYVEFNIPDVEKYKVTIDDYHFDVAKSSTELSYLSHICHNCVAGYTNSVQYGRSIILYGISEKSYPICIELDPMSNKIEQCYAPHNKSVDPENLLKCLKYFRQIEVDHNGWCSKRHVIQNDIFDEETGELLFAAGQVAHVDMDFDPLNDNRFTTYDIIDEEDLFYDITD